MFYLVLLACVFFFMSAVAMLDARGRRRLRAVSLPPSQSAPDPLAAAIADVARAMASRFGSKHGPLLRLPEAALEGARQEHRPCLTPIDCVQDRRCAGHCACG